MYESRRIGDEEIEKFEIFWKKFEIRKHLEHAVLNILNSPWRRNSQDIVVVRASD